MAFKSEKISTIKPRLLDWLENESAGGNVIELAEDLFNRAQEELRIYKKWSHLRKVTQLSLTNKSVALPSDCGEICSVYVDTDGDNKPDKYYFNSKTNLDNGYYITTTYSKSTGFSETITFYADVQNTITIEYAQNLDDLEFEDYCPFPSELILAKAKEMYFCDSGITDMQEYQILSKRVRDLLRDFSQSLFQNVRVVIEPVDDNGNILINDTYDLANGGSGLYDNDGHSNDYDRGN